MSVIDLTPTETTTKIYTHANVEKLQATTLGTVLVPGDADYEVRRKAWNLTFEHQPAVIVVASTAWDIVEAVRFARAEGLEIAIQATGHGVIRPAVKSMLIVTSQMTEVVVDPDTQTAWVSAGAKWQAVLDKVVEFGLAPLLGSTPDVGAVGYTLGGGMGWLARKYGMSLDSVNYFEVVTPEGRLVRASSTENTDLFWALRGGGGNFGVVTGMEIRLYPVSVLYAGNLLYPIEMAKLVYNRYREWVATAPDELTSAIGVMNIPPLPLFPEFMQGKAFIYIRGAYCGPVEEGEALLKFWREWHAPIVDDFKTIPFSQVATISNDPVEPSAGRSTGGWLNGLSDNVIDTVIRALLPIEGGSPIVMVEIRHAGGAIARVACDANAYSNRDSQHILQLLGMTPTPESIAYFKQYTDEVKRALQPDMTGRVYANFIEGEEARERTKDVYTPENLERLQAIKAQYDADNTFNHSYAISPSSR